VNNYRRSARLPVTDAEEREYHRKMEEMTRKRGYLNLAQAHALAATDCPLGCGCWGCVQTKESNAERIAMRDAKRKAAAIAREEAAA